MIRHTFSKNERLRSRKLLEKIIEEGKSISHQSFRFSWIFTALDTTYPAQLAIAVPKRFFKRAVDRNRIKRMIREVYRTNKSGLYSLLKSQGRQCALLLVFTGREIPGFAEVEKKFLLTLQKFEDALIKNNR